jgi:ABC-type polar amino acid transport system ATPase subunit
MVQSAERWWQEVEIAVRKVCKQFGERKVLDGVNLSIRPGETVAVIGPSGGGKSTLLRCLNGLCSFDEGEIQIGDQVLRPGANGGNASTGVRRILGMIFQDFQLFPHLTVLQNIIEAPVQVLRLSKNDACERGRRLLRRVGLADREDAYPRQLSGGQKQRVAIARALSMAPRGLLCDEITSSLDPELKNEVLAVIEDLKREGLTIVMVTHEIGFARRAADRVVVLAGGKNIEDGPAREVIDHPRMTRTQEFLKCVLG